jgi:hypothetical protein
VAAVSWLCPILEANRTKMFHVKRFGTIGGKIFQTPLTECRLLEVELRREAVCLVF